MKGRIFIVKDDNKHKFVFESWSELAGLLQWLFNNYLSWNGGTEDQAYTYVNAILNHMEEDNIEYRV